MALPLTEKLKRILVFLIGARNPRVFAVLGRRGFDQDNLEEGWTLFTVAAGARLKYIGKGRDRLAPDVARRHLAALDEWENSWFPVVSATLTRHFPALHESLFHNLSQTYGPEVLVSVGTLLDRLKKMRAGADGQRADELLASRGLTEQVRAEAATIIDRLRRSEDAPLPEIDPVSKEEQENAGADAWAWYREWSQIARTVIKRGDVLIRLGLRQPTRRAGSGETTEGEEAGEEAEEE